MFLSLTTQTALTRTLKALLQQPSWCLSLIFSLEIMCCQQGPWQHPTHSLHSTDSANSDGRPTLAAQCWARGQRWRRRGTATLAPPATRAQVLGRPWGTRPGQPPHMELPPDFWLSHLCICSWHPIQAISLGRARLFGGPGGRT